MIDLGAFEGDYIELIGGQLVVAEPKGAYHSSAVSTAEYALRAVLPPGWIVRTQAAISLDDESEPDLVVARAGTQDYWIVNLVDRAVAGTIVRSPRSRSATSCLPSPSRPSGFSSPTCSRSGQPNTASEWTRSTLTIVRARRNVFL